MKKALPLVITGIVLLTIAVILFFIHIIMLGNVIGKTPAEVAQLAEQPGLIGYLAGHTTVYGLLFVAPLFITAPLGLFFLIYGLNRGKAIDRRTEKEQK